LPLEDGFETVAAGDYPDETGWLTLYYGKSAAVSDAAAADGSNSFRLDCWPWSAAAEYVFLDEVPDLVTFEASVRVDPQYGLAGDVGFMKSVAGDGLLWNFFRIDGEAGQVEFFGDGVWLLGGYTLGTWCTVRADLDYQDQTADVWLDGAQVLAGVPIMPKEFYSSSMGDVALDKLTLVANNYYDGIPFVFSNVVYFDDLKVWTGGASVSVDIDVSPGGNPNVINCRSRGVVPVAILSSDSFDATQIDVSTVGLSGAAVAMRGRHARYMAHTEDVNGDGLLDLVLQFETQQLDFEQLREGSAVLAGTTLDGQDFGGSDEVVLVGRRCRRGATR
jgi:hypothetical protein